MALTNAYCTADQLKSDMLTNGQSIGTDWDVRIELAINAASRQIDGHTGRRFWQDGSVSVREFFADDAYECTTDDISTVTGLIVKVDANDDGTYATTLTINTDFILLPMNAADRVPVWPYNCIRIVGTGTRFVNSWSGRPGVQVTAEYGWPAVPDDVTKACAVQALQLFKSGDAAFGGLSFGDSGFMRVRDTLNPIAAALLEPYCKPRVA